MHRLLAFVAALTLGGSLGYAWLAGPARAAPEGPGARISPLATLPPGISAYLPLVGKNVPGEPWASPFGIITFRPLITGSLLLSRTLELGVGWAHLADRISWMALQPDENGPILWDVLAGFEEELRALHAAGIAPVVGVKYSPRWATALPTSCGPLRADAFDDFAAFMQALVARYKNRPFDVHHWEFGNEPDVDPELVQPDNGYGCWGDRDDPYYGGQLYGAMLQAIAPAIRAEDPAASLWIGGLLLDRPYTTTPDRGRPELFLQGILESGAADSFDIVAYHYHAGYQNQIADHDNQTGGPWDAWGGGVGGKARFLRQWMAGYGVEKPVFLNETGLGCPAYFSWCLLPDESFERMQASFLVRSFVRGLSADIAGFFWFTLEPIGWRQANLLDGNLNPKPVYLAYQHLTRQLQQAQYARAVDYGEGIEAYAFRRGLDEVHIAWAQTDQVLTLTLPQEVFIAAFDRDGNPLPPTPGGTDVTLEAGFDPIFVVRVAEP